MAVVEKTVNIRISLIGDSLIPYSFMVRTNPLQEHRWTHREHKTPVHSRTDNVLVFIPFREISHFTVLLRAHGTVMLFILRTINVSKTFENVYSETDEHARPRHLRSILRFRSPSSTIPRNFSIILFHARISDDRSIITSTEKRTSPRNIPVIRWYSFSTLGHSLFFA